MSAHQATFPIKTMVRVFKVSASGYAAWPGRPASARASADLDLTRKIRTIHAASRGAYGAPRAHAEFKAEGVAIDKKRVARLMQAAGLVGAGRRRSVTTTRRNPEHRPANDLVRRNSFAEKPNELWVADITFAPTLAGFLFLAVVLDAWSRRIVGRPSASPHEGRRRPLARRPEHAAGHQRADFGDVQLVGAMAEGGIEDAALTEHLLPHLRHDHALRPRRVFARKRRRGEHLDAGIDMQIVLLGTMARTGRAPPASRSSPSCRSARSANSA